MALCDYIEYQAQLEEEFYDWLNGEGFHRDYEEAVQSLSSDQNRSSEHDTIDPETDFLQILL